MSVTVRVHNGRVDRLWLLTSASNHFSGGDAYGNLLSPIGTCGNSLLIPSGLRLSPWLNRLTTWAHVPIPRPMFEPPKTRGRRGARFRNIAGVRSAPVAAPTADHSSQWTWERLFFWIWLANRRVAPRVDVGEWYPYSPVALHDQ